MSTLPIRLRLPVFLCGALALLISFCGNSTADEAADEKFIATEKTKLRKKVEILFRKGKGDHFAIAMIENTFHTDGMRTTIRNVVVNGKNMQDEVTEFRIGGAYFPVPAAEFKVIEGQDAAVDAVVDHMAKYIRPRPTKQIAGPKGKATESPPPTGDWQFIGRFERRLNFCLQAIVRPFRLRPVGKNPIEVTQRVVPSPALAERLAGRKFDGRR